MHITRVELENIKSHTSSVFDFGRGSTAITGENGAGKTTIIEAIAWTCDEPECTTIARQTYEMRQQEFNRRARLAGSTVVHPADLNRHDCSGFEF